jgi:hypothetical protein
MRQSTASASVARSGSPEDRMTMRSGRSVDHQAGCNHRRERLGDVHRELRDLATCLSAKGVEVSDSVQGQQKWVQTGAVADDDARVRTHLQVRGIAT